MLRALQRGLQFQLSPKAEAVYRVWSEDTLCRKDPHKVIRERTRLMERFIAWLHEEKKATRCHERIAGQAYLEMARTLAKGSIPEANLYLKERKRDHKITLAGDAAPLAYRTAYRMFGFRRAEKFALYLRSRHHA